MPAFSICAATLPPEKRYAGLTPVLLSQDRKHAIPDASFEGLTVTQGKTDRLNQHRNHFPIWAAQDTQSAAQFVFDQQNAFAIVASQNGGLSVMSWNEEKQRVSVFRHAEYLFIDGLT